MDATNKEGSPKQLRGRSLGTKLGEAEYAQCEQAAARRGQSLSEWCRQVLLDAAVSPAQAPEAEGCPKCMRLSLRTSRFRFSISVCSASTRL